MGSVVSADLGANYTILQSVCRSKRCTIEAYAKSNHHTGRAWRYTVQTARLRVGRATVTMKIAVIGANGRTGRCFVDRALRSGHEVRAGVRRHNPFVAHDRLTVVPCDATVRDQVGTLIDGCDMVVSLIGHISHSPPRVQTEAMKVLVAGLSDKGIKRVVSLTGTGVRQSGDTITLIDRLLNAAVTVVDPDRVRDGIEHAAVLSASDLEWTIIRVLKLQTLRPRPYMLTAHGPTKPFVGRAEVAEAILEVLEQHTFVGQMPMLSYPSKR